MGSSPTPASVAENKAIAIAMDTKRVRFVEPMTHQSPTQRDEEDFEVETRGESKPEMVEDVCSGESSMVACPTLSGKALNLPLPTLSAQGIVADEKDRRIQGSSKGEQGREDCHSQPESGRQPLRFLANSVSISVNSRNQDPKGRDARSQHVTDAMNDVSVSRVSKGVSCVRDFEAEQKRVMLETRLERSTFQFWRVYSTKRRWKKLVQLKDDQICFLMQKLEGAVSRPLVYCKRQRLRRIMEHWFVYSIMKRCKRQQCVKADTLYSRKSTCRLFQMWRHVSAENVYHATQERRSSNKFKSIVLSKCIQAFRNALQWPQIAAYQYEVAACMRRRQLACLSFCALIYRTKLRQSERHLKSTIDTSIVQRAFKEWRKGTHDSIHWARMDKEASKKYSKQVLANAFYGWCGRVDGDNFMTLLEQNIFAIHTIEQLHSDNVRLAKVVDGGAWGDHQIELIHSATNALREEKESLKKILNQFPWSRDRRMLRKTEQRERSCQERCSSQCPDVFLRLSQPISNSARRTCSGNEYHTEETKSPTPERLQCKPTHCIESTTDKSIGFRMGLHASGTSLEHMNGSSLEHSAPKTVIPINTTSIIHTVQHVKDKFKSMGYMSSSKLS